MDAVDACRCLGSAAAVVCAAATLSRMLNQRADDHDEGEVCETLQPFANPQVSMIPRTRALIHVAFAHGGEPPFMDPR